MGTIKGIILIPTINNGYPSIGRYINLFNIIKKDLGFEIKFTNNCNINELNKYDIVIIFKIPENHCPDLMSNIVNLSNNVKLIGYWTDIHSMKEITYNIQDTVYYHNLENIFDRCDKILCAYKSPFMERWGNLNFKFEHFPHFAEYLIENTKNKINKCLVSGAIDPIFYPIRSKVIENLKEYTHKLNHPGYRDSEQVSINKGFIVGKNYYEYINNYFCSLATSGIKDYTVGKYFEIPASGSLLVANTTNDMKNLGFVKNKHYIEITTNNYIDIIKDLIESKCDYSSIIKSCQELIKNNYMIKHSAKKLKEIIYEVCSL